MPIVGRLCAALAVPLVLPAAAGAQVSRSALVAPVEAGFSIVLARSDLPDLRVPPGDLRVAPGPARNGLIGMVPLGHDLQIVVGRLAVPNFTAPRMEGADIRRGDRSIAAAGFSFRF